MLPPYVASASASRIAARAPCRPRAPGARAPTSLRRQHRIPRSSRRRSPDPPRTGAVPVKPDPAQRLIHWHSRRQPIPSPTIEFGRDPEWFPATAQPRSGWSIDGAERSQPTASGGKRIIRASRLTTYYRPPLLASSCDGCCMVRRGSPVRVRKRALRKPRTSALFRSGPLAPHRTLCGYGAVPGAPQIDRPCRKGSGPARTQDLTLERASSVRPYVVVFGFGAFPVPEAFSARAD
jgi:hypothetical protein